ncbi:MAG TPA: GTPase-associated protein 1-related protein [Pseudonocardia sp.]|nr:GTPase-associated protein 1-related protein [Pseudonocardia sp.]
MTPRSGGFGALYYTDCSPGQGLQGGAGFQFQAASGPPAAEAMALVQRTALYEPPPSWMRERRPVAEYPTSLAHVAADGLLVTAAGRYLGQEADGTREGNQFTHAVITREPADYGLTRPAQLWAAPWWASGPAPGTELARMPAQPPAGPLDAETVRDRVRAAPGGAPLLVALLSAVHRLTDPAQRRTIALIASEPERAACWVAAATLLLPQPVALRASFKIFVADAGYGQHDIIALHPQWAGPWADPDAGSGLLVFDLDAGRAAPVEPTAAARFWVPRFLAQDVYDVLDAVELAGQFTRARDVDVDDPAGGDGTAERIAAVVVAAGERIDSPEHAARLAGWLLAAPEPVAALARDAVIDAVICADPGVAVLRTLAAASTGRGWVAAARVRDALLAAELAGLLAAADGISALRGLLAEPAVDGPAAAEDTASPARPGLVETALRAARPDQVPALLTLAHRFRVRPAAAGYRDTAHAFVGWWVDRTEAELGPDRWPAPPEALDWVCDELRARLAGPHAAVAQLTIRDRWWRHLRSRAVDPLDELDRQVLAAAMAQLEPSGREPVLRAVLDGAFGSGAAGEHPCTVAWRTLFGIRAPSSEQAYEFLLALRKHDSLLSPQVTDRIGMVLADEHPLTAHGLWCARELHRLQQSLPGPAADAAADDVRLHQLLDELARPTPSHPPAQLAALVDDTPEAVLAVRAPDVVEALLNAPREAAIEVLRRCSRPPYLLVRALERRWPGPSGIPDDHGRRALALSFLLLRGPTVVEGRAADLAGPERRLEELVRALSEPARAAVDAAYAPALGRPWQDWVATVTSTRRRLLRRLEARTGRDRSGRDRFGRDRFGRGS